MPGKSKRKKLRYSSNNPNRMGQKPVVKATAQPVGAGTPIASKTPSATVKSSPSASKGTVAQFTADQFKHVGSELKVVGILSAIILVVIIALFFVLH